MPQGTEAAEVGGCGPSKPAGGDACDQAGGRFAVACLAGREVELDRTVLGVNERLDLGGEAASETTHTSISTPPFLPWPRAVEPERWTYQS